MEISVTDGFGAKKFHKPSPFTDGAQFKVVSIQVATFGEGREYLALKTSLSNEMFLSIGSFLRSATGKFANADGTLTNEELRSAKGTAVDAIRKVLSEDKEGTNMSVAKAISTLLDGKTIQISTQRYSNRYGRESVLRDFNFVQDKGQLTSVGYL